MCGLIGVIGNSVEPDLLRGLSFLQYRGYDSYGICVAKDQKLQVRKKIGHFRNEPFKLAGTIGIGHTRWATHGEVTIANAHPIWYNHIAVVQNGIIENHQDIRKLFPDFPWSGETDTEAILPLFLNSKINAYFLHQTMNRLDGSFAIVILNAITEELYFMKKGPVPLAIGIGRDKSAIASDVRLLTDFEQLIEVEDGQCGILGGGKISAIPNRFRYIDDIPEDNVAVMSKSSWFESEFVDQPKILRNALSNKIAFPAIHDKQLDIIGCGSAYLAGAIGQHWMREIGKVQAYTYFSSELPQSRSCLLAISQSGETADTLRALQNAKSQSKVGLINNQASIMCKHVDHNIPTLAGPEISVASTKATTSQMLAILRWACHIARLDMSEELQHIFNLMEDFIQTRLREVEDVAKLCAASSSMFVLGRGILFPVACEGALKIKELSYIHAEGMCTAELKHGPIALLDKSSIVICLAPDDEVAVSEMSARGAQVIVFTASPHKFNNGLTFAMPVVDRLLSPFLYLPAMQWLAYSLALLRGNNIDMPRNLAKSVTVV